MPISKKQFPPQHQNKQPGVETEMNPTPQSKMENYMPAGKLKGKVALITGGDSGIGRAVAIAFAKEGANVAIVYLNEHNDAKKTKELVEEEGKECLLISGDVGDPDFSESCVKEALSVFKRLDILVNNCAEQHPTQKFRDITPEQLERTFRTNIFSYFFMSRAALPHLKEGSCIINTTSVTAYRGSEHLVDYSATKGAIVTFTRSLALNLVKQKIRVNGVAPGPIWTPLIPSTFNADHVEQFGSQVPMGRAGQPEEVAPAYVFLASPDSSYITGQVIHPNGGEIING